MDMSWLKIRILVSLLRQCDRELIRRSGGNVDGFRDLLQHNLLAMANWTRRIDDNASTITFCASRIHPLPEMSLFDVAHELEDMESRHENLRSATYQQLSFLMAVRISELGPVTIRARDNIVFVICTVPMTVRAHFLSSKAHIEFRPES